MKLTIAASNTVYQIDGTSAEISQILSELLGSKVSVPASITPASTSTNTVGKIKNLKVVQFDKPAVSELTQDQAKILKALFAYPVSKNTDQGRPAYVAAILLDGKPHTVKELRTLSNAITTKPVHTAINRLRASGSTVKVTTKHLNADTVVHVTKIKKNVKPIKFKKVANKTAFQNLSI